jgi:endonuclease/exonuclease/phosphatase family metal-dependent hydrolase
VPASSSAGRRRFAAAAAVPWAAWALLRAAGAERGFPLVPAVAFTPQAAVGSLLPLALGLAARSRAAVLLSAGAGAALATAASAHRTRPQPTPAAEPADRLRVATVSLRQGLVPASSVLDLVREHDVDVLAVQELTPPALARLRSAGIERLLPHAHVLLARPGQRDSAAGAVWSRRPITDRDAVAGSFQQPTARIDTAAGPVEVTAVHIKAPVFTPDAVRSWTSDLAGLPAPGKDRLRILAGDFNATLDHAELRRLLDRGYRDAAEQAGSALRPTWPAGRTLLPALVTIDHVLADRRIRVLSARSVPIFGSDHRGILAELLVPGDDRAGG